MQRLFRAMTGALTVTLILVFSPRLTMTQIPEPVGSVPKAAGAMERKPAGILLLAHGGKPSWNEAVKKLATEVDAVIPVEVAFGMATQRNIQEGINRLSARGVREVFAVPLFVSSHSSVIRATQYLLGLRAEAPLELATFAAMDHSHDEHHASRESDSGLEKTTPIRSTLRIRMTSALDCHPIVADILLSRAQGISRDPAHEVVVVVAHGPVSEEDNAKWLADMRILVDQMRDRSSFKRIERLTVRDDAPETVRSEATAALRAVVEGASREGNRVLVVPLLLSYGGIEEGIKERLRALDYVLSPQALLPDERIARWILLAMETATQNLE